MFCAKSCRIWVCCATTSAIDGGGGGGGFSAPCGEPFPLPPVLAILQEVGARVVSDAYSESFDQLCKTNVESHLSTRYSQSIASHKSSRSHATTIMLLNTRERFHKFEPIITSEVLQNNMGHNLLQALQGTPFI